MPSQYRFEITGIENELKAMAQKTDIELTTEANVIGDETTPLANTADRVRDMLVNIIDSKKNGNPWRGSWAGTTALPVDADNVGSAANGGIQAGDQFVFTNQVVFGGSVFPAKSIAVALQATPTTLAHWSILAAQT